MDMRPFLGKTVKVWWEDPTMDVVDTWVEPPSMAHGETLGKVESIGCGIVTLVWQALFSPGATTVDKAGVMRIPEALIFKTEVLVSA